jgi:hypothetical protein
MVFTIAFGRRPVLEKAFAFPALPSKDGSQVLFSDPFELLPRRNIRIQATAPVDNGWVHVEGDLVNEETGLVQNFSIPIEYYHGVDGGESWSEGATESELFLSALPAGRYTLRLEAQWGGDTARGRPGHWEIPTTVRVNVDQGVVRILHFAVVLAVLAVPVVVKALLHHAFERRRWSESVFNPHDS